MDIKSLWGYNKIDALFALALIVFSIYGASTKYLWFVNQPLNSDMVTPGLVSSEIWRHHDYLLYSYYLPSAYPNLFTDVITFHLIPQILSNFSPLGLKISSFIIYLFIIAIFSFIIYVSSKEKIAALIFITLMTNLGEYPVSTAQLLSLPAYHNGTLLFAGICIILYWSFLHSSGSESSILFVVLTLVADATLFSDSLIIPIFIIPSLLYYIFLSDKSRTLNQRHALMVMTFLAVFYIKTFYVSSLITYPVKPVSLQIMVDHISIYIDGISRLLLPLPWEGLSLWGYLIIALYAMLVYWSAKYILLRDNNHLKYIFFIFIISSIVLSIAYICTSLCVDVWTSRYLLFIPLGAFSLISIAYCGKKHMCMLLVLAIVLLGAYNNFYHAAYPQGLPNQDELELIGFLNENGLKYGYGTFWYSNVITYLSNENIIICPAVMSGGIMGPFYHLSSIRWYGRENSYSKYFIIHKNGDEGFGFIDLPILLNRARPDREIHFKDYTMYIYDSPNKTAVRTRI